jgi:hypothetical protein
MTWPMQSELNFSKTTPKKQHGRKSRILKRSLSSPRETVVGQIIDDELEFRDAQLRKNTRSR